MQEDYNKVMRPPTVNNKSRRKLSKILAVSTNTMATLVSMPESAAPTKQSPHVDSTPFLDTKNHDTDQDTTQTLNRNEFLPWDSRSRFAAEEASEISEQVRLLREISRQIASQDSPRQFVWNTILQIVYVAIGFLFGVFSIFQWHAQWIANGMTLQANGLALIAICLSSNSACLVPYI